MGYATKLGRARISPSRPQAAGVCDRCGFIFTHSDLRFQFDYAGAGLVNRQVLVCRRCEDDPQPQLKAIVLPADPVPINNPRPMDFASQRQDKRITIGETIVDPKTLIEKRTGDQRTTMDDNDRIVQKNGDDMLAPKFVTFRRITAKKEPRITMTYEYRVTQLMPDIQPNPAPPPHGFAEGPRMTMEEDIRIVNDGRILDCYYALPTEALMLTVDGKTRITQKEDIRDAVYYQGLTSAPKRVFDKRKKTEK